MSDLRPPEPIPAEPPKRRTVSLIAPLSESYTNHPGWGLQADAIRAHYEQAEVGYPAGQCDIFDDVLERDAHLRALFEARIQEVAGKGWIMQAGGDTTADTEAAQVLEMAIRRIPNSHHTWRHLLSKHFYGYAGVEIDWSLVDGYYVPVWFSCVPHRRFCFDVDTDEPRLITREGYDAGEPLAPGKWLFVTRHHRKVVRSGLMRTATWWSQMKSIGVRDWQLFCARFGIPFVLGTYEELTSNEETISKLREAIIAFGKNGGAVLPSATALDVKEIAVQGNNASVHPGIVEMCNRENSKLIAGGTLTSDQGTTGSYGQGTVHAAQKFTLALADEAELGHDIQVSLGSLFVRFNGLKVRPPRLRHRVVPDLDPLARIQMMSIYANELGGTLDDDQIRVENDFKLPTGLALVGTKKPAAPTEEEPPEEPGQGTGPGPSK